MNEERALTALKASGIGYQIVRHGPVRSLAEAAAARGVEPGAVVKTMVVRRGADDYVFVLVPGDRTIAWPKLRAVRTKGCITYRVVGYRTVGKVHLSDLGPHDKGGRHVDGYRFPTTTPDSHRRPPARHAQFRPAVAR